MDDTQTKLKLPMATCFVFKKIESQLPRQTFTLSIYDLIQASILAHALRPV